MAVLHLTHAFMRQQQPDLKLQAVYITEEKAFPQVNEFVQESINRSVLRHTTFLRKMLSMILIMEYEWKLKRMLVKNFVQIFLSISTLFHALG